MHSHFLGIGDDTIKTGFMDKDFYSLNAKDFLNFGVKLGDWGFPDPPFPTPFKQDDKNNKTNSLKLHQYL